MQGPKRFWAERLKPYAARGQPHACTLCRDRIRDKIGFEARSVVHADLIPTTVGLQLFRAMPASIKGKALLAALTGKGKHLLLLSFFCHLALVCRLAHFAAHHRLEGHLCP